MRVPYLFPVGPLRADYQAHAAELAAHGPGRFPAALSGQRGRAVREGDPRLDVGVLEERRANSDTGTVRGGGQRASGAGRADGSDVRATGGRDLDGAPRFDQPVASGAYLWWYVDALSDCGNYGLTIIAFVGSVFSPYYRSALARGQADPANHCALNVALYGAKRRWTMTERGRSSMARDAERFVIGPSELHWDGNALTISIRELGVPLPFPVRGTVRVHPGALSTLHVPIDDQGRHRWGPIAPCARVEVELERPGLRWQGHAYLDSNEGDEPIERAFHEWDWSRATLSDGSTAVIYDVQQKGGPDRLLGLRFFTDGRIEEFMPPPRQALSKTGWRIDRRMRTDEGSTVRVIDMLEDTPFYERSLLASSLFGERVISMHETLNVPRLSSPIVQRMLPFRMPRFG